MTSENELNSGLWDLDLVAVAVGGPILYTLEFMSISAIWRGYLGELPE